MSCLSILNGFWCRRHAASYPRRLYAAVDPLPLPPAATAQTPIRRATAAADPSICKLSIQMGEKGRKMCFACSNGRWLYYIYVRFIHKHAVRYVAVACGVLSRRLIHYLPDGTTFLIDSSSFHFRFFFARKVRVAFVVLFFLKHSYRCSAFSKFFVINSWLPLSLSLYLLLYSIILALAWPDFGVEKCTVNRIKIFLLRSLM